MTQNKTRNHDCKSVTFDKRDPEEMDLLAWADSKPLPMNFTQIVHYALGELRRKLESDQTALQAEVDLASIDLTIIERAAERGAARALANVNLTKIGSAQHQSDPETDRVLETNLANLF